MKVLMCNQALLGLERGGDSSSGSSEHFVNYAFCKRHKKEQGCNTFSSVYLLLLLQLRKRPAESLRCPLVGK